MNRDAIAQLRQENAELQAEIVRWKAKNFELTATLKALIAWIFTETPEPSPDLVEHILAATSGSKLGDRLASHVFTKVSRPSTGG